MIVHREDTGPTGRWVVEVTLDKPFCCRCGWSVRSIEYHAMVTATVFPSVAGERGSVMTGTESEGLIALMVENLAEKDDGFMSCQRETVRAACGNGHFWEVELCAARVGDSPMWTAKQIACEVKA